MININEREWKALSRVSGEAFRFYIGICSFLSGEETICDPQSSEICKLLGKQYEKSNMRRLTKQLKLAGLITRFQERNIWYYKTNLR